MKVILEKRVEKLGLPGEVVNVADGYARNFLIPNKCAVPATKNNIDRVQRVVKKLELEYIKEVDEAKKVAAQIEKLSVTVKMPAGENDRLYGAVTAHQIVDAMAEKGITLEKKKVHLPEHIKDLGEHQVEIKVHPDVTAKLKLLVEKLEEKKDEKKEEKAEE
jgi:large subunit ribosomal protein L9